MKPAIGFIGLGQMGGAIVRTLVARGHRVIVHDRSTQAVRRTVDAGAVAAESARDVADKAEVVFACLPSFEACSDAALGPDGIVGGRAARIYVELSSIGPADCETLAQGLAAKDITLVDVPVSGGVPAAENGTLTCIVAGPDEAVAQIGPLLAGFSSHAFVVGPKAGQAQVCKLVNSALSLSAMVITSEALTAGVKLGLDAQAMLDVINASTGASVVTRDKFPRAILPRTMKLGAHLSQCVKDMELYLDVCKQAGIPSLATQSISQLYRLAAISYGKSGDAANVVRLFENWAGVEVAGHKAAD